MSETKHDLISPIRRYFRCLWMALRGRDPYGKDCERLQERIDEANIKLNETYNLYCSAIDNWSKACENVKELEKRTRGLLGEIAGYQKLIENLRETIRDKEILLTEYTEKLHI